MSAKSFFVLTAFGKDRPGMVAGVSQALFEVGGNIEDASMTRLGGEFTMMLVVSVPSRTTLAALQKAVAPQIAKLSMDIVVKPLDASVAHVPKAPEPQYLMSVYGTDHPGIVSAITQALATRKISITDLQTKVSSGPKPLYVMLLEVSVPKDLDHDAWREELDTLRQSLQVEITLQDIDPVAL